MNLKIILSLLLVASVFASNAQETKMNTESTDQLPFYEIPDYPESFTATTVAARMIEGLGFRYYWGTEGLRDEDLSFKPSEEGRTTLETLEHIHGLSTTIVNGARNVPNVRTGERPTYSYEELREKTLNNLKEASDLLRNMDGDEMDSLKVVFQRNDSSSEFPFWVMINGPIADAIWQVVQAPKPQASYRSIS